MKKKNKQNNFPYIELASLTENGRMYRKIFVRANATDQIKSWRARFKNTDVFASIGFYSRPNHNCRAVYPLFFDIDCGEDLEKARQDCIKLVNFLCHKLRISEEDVSISFSGNKGFHVEISPIIFSAFYSPVFMKINRKLARRAIQARITTLDTGIYDRKRIWRLPDTKNSKSGLYKVGLSYYELVNTNIQGIKKAAAGIRNFEPLNKIRPQEYASRWFRTQVQTLKRAGYSPKRLGRQTFNGKGWRMVPCVKKIEKATLPDGIRHQTYFVLARYYAYLGMHPAEACERIMEIDSRHPIRDPDSIYRAVDNAQKMPGFAGCDNKVLQLFCVGSKKCFLKS
jgi:hypothetical protein